MVVAEFCEEHDGITVVLYVKFKNYSTAEKNIYTHIYMGKRVVARFEFKMSFRRISYVAAVSLGNLSIIQTIKTETFKAIFLQLTSISCIILVHRAHHDHESQITNMPFQRWLDCHLRYGITNLIVSNIDLNY